MSSIVIGLDIGTTSLSVVAIDASGRLKASVTRPHAAAVRGLPDGCAEQSPVVLWQAVIAALQQARDATSSDLVHAIGLTGQMHSTLLLGEDHEPLSNTITWQDKRAVTLSINDGSLFDILVSRIPASAMESTGCRLAPGYMGTTLFTLQQMGNWPQNIHRASFVADWIGGKLCQQPPVTDRSHAASSGLYDLRNDCWSPELLEATQTQVAWLPNVMASGTVIGEVAADVANKTGLVPGTRVCNAIGDNQAAVLSSLPEDNHALLINIGTGGQIVWRIPRFDRVSGMDTRYLPSLSKDTGDDEHQYMLVGAGLCGGDSFGWINRTVREWLKAFGVVKTEEEVWQSLSEQLQMIPEDMATLHCEPFFAGTRPQPSRRAVFRDVGTGNFTPANIARSILNGIAETMHGVYESAAGRRPEPLTGVAMSGNGSRRNPLLVAAVEQRFGVPASVAPCREEAATGAAMLAGVRTGMWPDLRTAQNTIHRAAVSGVI